jgi:hypothetical protein
MANQRIQILWKRFFKEEQISIFNDTEVNSIRGIANLKQARKLLNGVSSSSGILVVLEF